MRVGKTISITLPAEKKSLTKVRDFAEKYGEKFDYSTVVDPDLNRYINEQRQGGLGIYLVRQLNESVQYERVGNSNILTLSNKVKPASIFSISF